MSTDEPSRASTTLVNADLAEVAAAADAVRVALGRLANAVRKVPGTKINLVRSLELLEQLADRAKYGAFRPNPDTAEALVRSLTGSLAAVQASGSPLGPDKAAELEKEIRRALAAENGALGGREMTERKLAALAKLHERRRARRAGLGNAEQSQAGGGVTDGS